MRVHSKRKYTICLFLDPIKLMYLYTGCLSCVQENLALRPPGGGSITVFSAFFNKAVLLSYAFTLDPYSQSNQGFRQYMALPLKY